MIPPTAFIQSFNLVNSAGFGGARRFCSKKWLQHYTTTELLRKQKALRRFRSCSKLLNAKVNYELQTIEKILKATQPDAKNDVSTYVPPLRKANEPHDFMERIEIRHDGGEEECQTVTKHLPDGKTSDSPERRAFLNHQIK